MSPQERKVNYQQTNIIKESINPRAIDALMSTYKDAQLAVMDLVDNAVDNRIEGKPQGIRVRITRDELSITNQGGYGLDFEGLKNYFVWGHSDKAEGKIGKFGVGGKAAMGFLGRGMEINCSADGSNSEYRVFDTTWETREGELKQYQAEEKPASTTEGFFRVKITDLKREVNASIIAAKLGDVYRPLLLDGSIKITVNGKDVEPTEIKYLEVEGISPQTLRVETRFGDWINLRVGILTEGQKVKPGIRCYYNGRLIEDEQFFGHPTPAQMSGSSRLFGEADLDFVPVTTNKSNFVRGSVQWEMAFKRMNTILTPIIDKLANLRITDKTIIERYEQDLAKEAKRILEHVLAETNIYGKAELQGSSSGRLPSTQRGDTIDNPETSRTHRPTEGETAPKLPAKGKTVRRGTWDDAEVVSMGITRKRGEIVEEKGKTIIKINSDYPLYQIAKKIGDDALKVYLNETQAIEFVRSLSKDKTVAEYSELVDQVLEGCGEMLRTKVRPNRTY